MNFKIRTLSAFHTFKSEINVFRPISNKAAANQENNSKDKVASEDWQMEKR